MIVCRLFMAPQTRTALYVLVPLEVFGPAKMTMSKMPDGFVAPWTELVRLGKIKAAFAVEWSACV